jgi:hypothetical protein
VVPQRLIDMRGQRFGKLVIGKHSHTARNGSRWHSVCDCGNAAVVSGSDVRAGSVTSCGCRDAEHRAAWPAEVADNRRGTFRIGSRGERRAAKKLQSEIDWTQITANPTTSICSPLGY